MKLCMYLGYLLIAAIFIGPIVFLFVSSLKPYADRIGYVKYQSIHSYGDLSLDNYINVIVKADFFKFFKNSVVVTIIFVLLATTINAMIGYALGMLNFRGKAIIISTIVALSIIPTESIIINRFMTVNSLGMLNTYIGLAIPSVAYPMYMYLYYNHFKGMPKELQEAAIIDGASYWKIFTKIMMPLSKPIITTVAIMAFIRSGAICCGPPVTRDGTYRTLPLALKSLFSDTYTDWGQVFAFSTLMVIPTMILFPVFQKQFVASVTSSGIKG